MNYKHWITGFAIVLLIYSGWRSFDYMTLSLSGLSATVATLVSLVFLFSSEIGLLIWLHVGAAHATTDAQDTISKIMIAVDFVGSVALGLADLLARNTLYTVNFAWLDPVLLVTPAILIAANVGAAILYHLNDADALIAQSERRLRYIETQAQMDVHAEAIRQVKGQRRELAARLAPGIAKESAAAIEGKVASQMLRKPASPQLATPPPAVSSIAPPAILASGNSNGKLYAAEVGGSTNLPKPPGAASAGG